MSKALKVIAIILAIGALIAGIIMGKSVPVLKESYGGYEAGFNWALMINYWEVGAIGALVFYALGEILGRIETLHARILELERKLAASVSSPAGSSPTGSRPAPTYPPRPVSSGTRSAGPSAKWHCPKCSEPNPANATICRNCGAHR